MDFWPAHRLYILGISAARRAQLGAGDVVVAGVSGGPDSCALMRVLRIASSRFGFAVQPAHLIHDFRGQETYDDAQFVRELWPNCIIEEVNVDAYQEQYGVSSFEQAARDLRYEFLGRVARRVDARLVTLGHTADDLAETVLLHVARGSGLHGLRGMSEFDDWPYPNGPPAAEPESRVGLPDHGQGLKVWRPLLELTRAHTIGYCRSYGVDYRDDSTNYMREFARNRLRLDLMPALAEQLNPRIVDALGRISRTAALHVDFVEQQADAIWDAVAPDPVTDKGVLRLRREGLAEAHPALQHIVLRRAWIAVTGQERQLTQRHLSAMGAVAVDSGFGKTIELPRGYSLTTERQWVVLAPPGIQADLPYPAMTGEFRLTLPWGPIAVAVTKRDGWEITCQSDVVGHDDALDTGNPRSAYLSAAALAEGATVRTWHPGDRMQPLGMSGTRKLQDVFTDARVPREWRHRVPLVVTPRGVAWVVGVRLADWAAVPRGTGDAGSSTTLIRFELSGEPNAG